MNFRTYVETPYRDWVIQQTWNHQAIQFDRVAVKGSQRVLQAAMTYQAFMQHLDQMDGLKQKPSPKPLREGEPAMTLRHDARLCRQKVTSEQVRIAHGFLTPEEIQTEKDKQERQRLAQIKQAQKGQGLFAEEL